MFVNSKRFPVKDSGIPWVGMIPTDWKVFPAGGVFSEVKEKNKNNQYSNPFSFRYGEIVDKKIGDIDESTEETLSAYRVVSPNTIMLNGLNLNYDFITQRVAIVKKKGIITSAYLAVKPDETRVEPRFMLYLLKSYDFHQVLHSIGSGIRKTLKYQDFKNLKIIAPDLDTQRRIADYLDTECKKIDTIIEDARASIEDYKAWKAATLYEAVTKGTNKENSTRDSGVSWIGSIPTHWQVSKIGRFIKIRSGITLGKTYPQGTKLIEMPYLRVANVKAEGFALEDVAKIKVTPEEAEKYALKSGELLMTEGGDRDKLGRGTIWHEEISPCLHQNHVFAVTCDENWLLTEYLAYLTASPVGREYFDLTAKKTTNLASTNSNTIMQFKVPIPPVSEQREIVALLDQKCAAINDLIAEKTELISDLELYKKSLIYEVVTGKRKVV